jgi:HSP20 family protein
MSRKEEKETGAVEPRHRGPLERAEFMPKFNPLSLIRRIAEDMDRTFEGAGFPILSRFGSRELEGFSPRVDMFKRDGKLVVRADLPGLESSDVTVEIDNNTIVIEGERKYEHEDDKSGVYRVERGYGRFFREISLPEGANPDTATATFKNGVLEISMEAPETEQRRRIEIKSEGQASQSESTKTPSEGATKSETTGRTEEKGPKVA